MNARYYLPEVGRFISPDTIVPEPGNPQSYNRYSYTLNSPVNYTDPTGHCVLGLPCPDSVVQTLDTAGDFLGGALAEILYNNSLGLATDLAPSPSESGATRLGRVIGDVTTMVQGGGEIAGGIGLMGGGAAACASGVGCIVTPGAEAAGLAAATHGAAIGATAVGQFLEFGNVLLAEGTNGFGKSDSRDFTRLSQGEVRRLEEAGYHPHELKPKKHGGRYDIFKDKDGNLYVMPKDGSGPGEDLGLNIHDVGE